MCVTSALKGIFCHVKTRTKILCTAFISVMLSHENKTSSGNKIIGCLLFSLCTWKHYCCWQLQYSNWDTNCSWKMVWVDIKLHETIRIQGCITTLTTSNFNKSFTLEIIFTKRISWIYLFGIYCVKQSLQSYRWRNMSICFEEFMFPI